MTEQRSATLGRTRQAQAQIILLVGESLDAKRRRAVSRAERPKVDMFEIESEVDARVHDYTWLRERAAGEPLTRLLVALASKVGFWHIWLALRVLFAARGTSVIYATGEDVGVAMALLLRLSGRRGPRLIVRIEEPVYGRTPLRRAIMRAIVGFGLRRVNLAVTRTPAISRRLETELGVPPERIRFVPVGVDTTFFNPQRSPEPTVVDRPEGPFLLSAGLELRDYETLIRAVRDLPVKVLIGAGSPWSRRRFGLAPDQLPDNVRVESFNSRQMRELYRSASLVVVPVVATTRTCGISVALEALAMARPLVITSTEGLAHYFEDDATAAMVPPGDVDALRARVKELLDDPERAAALAERGHTNVRANHTLDRMIKSFLALIREQAG